MRSLARWLSTTAVVALLTWSAGTAACVLHGVAAPKRLTTPAKALRDFDWVGPGFSGAWFDPNRSGEGVILEILPNGRALAVWFTYPPAGAPGEQAWMIAQDGVIDGDTIRFASVFRPRGGVFGAGFDAGAIVLEPWGTLTFRTSDCATAAMDYAGPAAFGSGTRTFTRLTVLDELDCGGARDLATNGGRALSGLRAKSGAWFVPARAGEGWLVEELADGRTVVYWFTYDPQGNQAWTIGVGARNGNVVSIPDNLITRGTRFGDAFDASAVQRDPWGSLEFRFDACNAAQVTYASTVPGYGSGTRAAQRLTLLASAPCLDGTPAVRTTGTWSAGAMMPPAPQSEHAAAVVDTHVYVWGGFGDPRGFKRYDTVANAWAELPDVPAGRDHGLAFALDGGVFAVGGFLNGGGEQQTSAFRYDVAQNRWESRAEIPGNSASGAAVLNGRAYLGGDDGSLAEYDPVNRRTRFIPRFGTTARDHSQVVAFMGEIWLLGGRSPETRTVAIYDPVSELWRAGPSMGGPRGGFAAATVGDTIVVAGGEALDGAFRTIPTAEVYTVGEAAWRFLPDLPVAVHGVAGAGVGSRFYAIGGATVAGTAQGAAGRVQIIEAVP